MSEGTGPGPADPALEWWRALARQLDSRFRIPGTSIRFGWDALLGLVPGLGDAIGGLMGGFGVYTAWRLGAPASVLLRLLLNVALDLAIGTLPLLGDLFDLGWKSNQRNLALIERWQAAPHQTHRRSALLLAGLGLLLLLLAIAAAWGVVRVAGWVLGGGG